MLVGAVGGTTGGAGACVRGLVVGAVGRVVGAVGGEPVDDPPVGAVLVVGSWLAVRLVVSGLGAFVAGVWTTCVLRGGAVPVGAGRTQ